MSKLGPYELNRIYTGDARELAKAIPDESVDLIFTDPPYQRDFLPLYDWLALESSRILKPEGFLLAYAGTYWKQEVMLRLSKHLDYFFDMILLNSGKSPILWHRKIISRHKSILAYSRHGYTPKPRVNVLSWWPGGGEDKRYHTWGQDESSARYYIDCFSALDAIVLDPLVGGGTTAAVCAMLRRRWLAFEIDPATADLARQRVANTKPPLFVPEPEQIELALA